MTLANGLICFLILFCAILVILVQVKNEIIWECRGRIVMMDEQLRQSDKHIHDAVRGERMNAVRQYVFGVVIPRMDHRFDEDATNKPSR